MAETAEEIAREAADSRVQDANLAVLRIEDPDADRLFPAGSPLTEALITGNYQPPYPQFGMLFFDLSCDGVQADRLLWGLLQLSDCVAQAGKAPVGQLSTAGLVVQGG